MYKAGITGGIGSGKSIVCSVFRTLGMKVYEADKRAKDIMNTNQNVKQSLIEKFGENAYTAQGLNTDFISSRVFNDKDALYTMNSIVHPAVVIDFENWCLQYTAEPYVIMEAALIFESEIEKRLDCTITVTAPEDIRINRIMARDRLNREEVMARMNNQMPDEYKTRHADYVIINDGKTLLLPQIITIHNTLLSKAKE